MTKNKIQLSIIIPALNEEKFIAATLIEISNYLDQQKISETTEVVVVAAGGGDKTAERARRESVRIKNFVLVTPEDKVGKGRDVAEGMSAASGQYKVFTDADLATPLHHLANMTKKLQAGADIVIGVRDIANMHDTLTRKLSSQAGNLLIRMFATPGIKDTQCGFKGFTAEAAERIFSQHKIQKWGFDFEVLAMARQFGYKIDQVSIPDWSDPKGDQGLVGESHIGAMVNTLRELFKVRINILRGLYK